MSVALIPMSNELGWSTTQRGLVSSAFFWGYAATQIPAGYIATRIGGAKVLLLGVMVWSIGVSAVLLCPQQTPASGDPSMARPRSDLNQAALQAHLLRLH